MTQREGNLDPLIYLINAHNTLTDAAANRQHAPATGIIHL
jgi:hypothetical protein